jgi:NitT/TauT family transport system ATP-binding protein
VDEAVFLGDRIMIMTAQPGRAKEIVDVPFGRPRDIMALQRAPEFGALVASIWASLRDEVLRARQIEEAKP